MHRVFNQCGVVLRCIGVWSEALHEETLCGVLVVRRGIVGVDEPSAGVLFDVRRICRVAVRVMWVGGEA